MNVFKTKNSWFKTYKSRSKCRTASCLKQANTLPIGVANPKSLFALLSSKHNSNSISPSNKHPDTKPITMILEARCSISRGRPKQLWTALAIISRVASSTPNKSHESPQSEIMWWLSFNQRITRESAGTSSSYPQRTSRYRPISWRAPGPMFRHQLVWGVRHHLTWVFKARQPRNLIKC